MKNNALIFFFIIYICCIICYDLLYFNINYDVCYILEIINYILGITNILIRIKIVIQILGIIIELLYSQNSQNNYYVLKKMLHFFSLKI